MRIVGMKTLLLVNLAIIAAVVVGLVLTRNLAALLGPLALIPVQAMAVNEERGAMPEQFEEPVHDESHFIGFVDTDALDAQREMEEEDDDEPRR